MYHFKLKFTAIVIIASALASGIIGLLIYSLEHLTLLHQKNLWLSFLLPIAALLTVSFYQKFAEKFKGGMAKLFEEIHKPSLVFPKRMSPTIYVATCLSHLVGASVGREGAALLMGVSFTDRLSVYFGLDQEKRKTFLMAMLSASFSAALNSPVSGVFFALETMNQLKTFFHSRTLYLVLASLSAFYVRQILPIDNEEKYILNLVNYDFKLVIGLIFFAILVGAFIRLFLVVLEVGGDFFHHKFPHPYYRPLTFSFILVALMQLPEFNPTKGMGFHYIDSFLLGESQNFSLLIYKFLATILSLFSELKGGEFVPMVYMGSLLGNIFGEWFNQSPVIFAMMGYVGMFAGASHAPIAMSFVALSLFGVHAFVPALIVCLIANSISGRVSVYKQRTSSRFKLFSK